MSTRLLIAEFLLADATAMRSAAVSMRLEAIAMLNAIVSDFRALPDVSPVVLMSAGSRSFLQDAGSPGLRPVEIIEVSDAGIADWFRNNERLAERFSAILLIAPECDGILQSLLQQRQSTVWRSVRSLNLSVPMASLFSDKSATAEWLDQNGIATPRTMTVSDLQARDILRSVPATVECNSVLKPRYGAGSDRIHPVFVTTNDLHRLESRCRPEDPWVLQQWIDGEHCSIGIIGDAVNDITAILPAARQCIVSRNGTLQYAGGQVPLAIPGTRQLAEVATQIAGLLAPVSGYVGIDAVISSGPEGNPQPVVIEINPRLCTSYMGYRQLSQTSLASLFLRQSEMTDLQWHSQPVSFWPNPEITVPGHH